LARVTRAGGVLIASVMGDWSPLTDAERALRDSAGFAHFAHEELRAALPHSHAASYHTREHVLGGWSRFFDVLDYRPRALNDDQDLVLAVKRT
ncbi:MAG TPA: hypothetical protein VFF06_11245, partial [Polyangia bacterium]|nr:hypothetical protein [Polyangia bacterium]